MINDNAKLSAEVREIVKEKFKEFNIAIWDFLLGDKLNCWNQYCCKIREISYLHVFVDGYVRVFENSLKLFLEYCGAHAPLGMTGIPTFGKSADKLRQEMLRNGGIHGNLYALPETTIEALCSRGFRLPIGLYRTDPLIGAVINYNFDPVNNDWDPKGIHVLNDVSWYYTPQKWYSMRDVYSQFKRYLRQGRGIIENKAIKSMLEEEKRSISEFPLFARELCGKYLSKSPIGVLEKIFNPSLWIAVNKLGMEEDSNSVEYMASESNNFREIKL